MTSTEIAKALRHCSNHNGSNCYSCPMKDRDFCAATLREEAADIIERLEEEKAALIEAASPRKLCDICKHDSWCAEHGCGGNLCEECGSYSACPCSNCMSYPKWEWKGGGNE